MFYRPKSFMGGKESTLRHLLETAVHFDDLSVLVIDLSESRVFGISPVQIVMKFAHEHDIPEVRFINQQERSWRHFTEFAEEFAGDIYPHITVTIS